MINNNFFLTPLIITIISTFFLHPVLADNRTALVFGNSNYQNAPLTNPVNDAADMTAKLRKLGFDVIHKENASRREMRIATRQFKHKLQEKGGVGLFYYAGHGIQVKGENFLIPVKADISEEFDIPDQAISANYVLRAMEDSGNSMNIIILDACRDNPFARRWRSSSRGLARMDAPSGSIVAYATSPGKTADDGNGRNGTYTHYLLKYMDETGLVLEEVFKKVRIAVRKQTANGQIPWKESSLYTNFYFIQNLIITPKLVSLPQGDSHSVELAHKPVKPYQPSNFSAPSASDSFTGMEFVSIEPGCFQMGSPTKESEWNNNTPQHKVCLSKGYYLGKYEVTQAQWQKVMGNNPSHFNEDNKPVENVSWNDVLEFIQKLNKQTKKTYRLPTEAEWEYACTSSTNMKYCGSNDINEVAWFNDNSNNETHSVGLKQQNGQGLYDMSGNVFEWVQDWYGDDFYGNSPKNNPKGRLTGSRRVFRGGSWYPYSNVVLSTYRSGNKPDYRDNDLGFRLARTW